jgi:uncharacterized protein YndB with AHSA1/START domain
MARQITAIDEAILAFPPEAVHAVVADLGRYHEWWGPPFRFETLHDAHGAAGTRLRVQHDMVRWDATVTHVDPEHIIVRYEDGSWVGETRWHVTPCQEGTRLIYRIELDPAKAWLKVLSRFLDLKRRHSHLMMDVFQRLRTRLETETPEAAAAHGPAAH